MIRRSPHKGGFLTTVRALFVGPGYRLSRNASSTFQRMRADSREFWRDNSFGLLRVTRLILSKLQYFNLFNYVCCLLDLIHPVWSRLFMDTYVVAKLVAPILLLAFVPKASFWPAFLAWYIIAETVVYLFSQIVISTSTAGPQSRTRTFLMILLNYVTLILCFAYIYYGYRLISEVDSPLGAIYFSVVTGSTTGFGDKLPTSDGGHRVVIMQILVTISFLVAFFTYFLPTSATEFTPRASSARNRHSATRNGRTMATRKPGGA